MPHAGDGSSGGSGSGSIDRPINDDGGAVRADAAGRPPTTHLLTVFQLLAVMVGAVTAVAYVVSIPYGAVAVGLGAKYLSSDCNMIVMADVRSVAPAVEYGMCNVEYSYEVKSEEMWGKVQSYAGSSQTQCSPFAVGSREQTQQQSQIKLCYNRLSPRRHRTFDDRAYVAFNQAMALVISGSIFITYFFAVTAFLCSFCNVRAD
jgi:hypothetical protein